MSRYPEVYMGADGRPYTEAAYRLTGPVQIDDIRWEEGEELIFAGCPNENMQPLNAAAERNYINWLRSLPDAGKARPDDLMQAAWEMRGKAPSDGEDPEAFRKWQLAVFERALAMKDGVAKRPTDALAPRVHRPSHEVPPMSNISLGNGTAAPAPKSNKVRTANRLPQSQRPQQSVPPVGTIADSRDQLPTS